MGGYHSFYGGSTYGLKPSFSEYYPGSPIAPDIPFNAFATATDPRNAAQLKAVSERLNTGMKTVEVSMIFPQVEESIPDQHLDEIYRLKKLVGADLTLHGPLIEPTGFNQEAGTWDESMRVQSERQMWSALQRGNKISPNGDLVVTFHSSNGLPSPEVTLWEEGKNGKEGVQKTHRIAVVDERSGKVIPLPAPKAEHLLTLSEEQRKNPAKAELDKINEQQWLQNLSQISQELGKADEYFNIATEGRIIRDYKEGRLGDEDEAIKRYATLKKEDPEKIKQIIKDAAKISGVNEGFFKQQNEYINKGDIMVRDAFRQFKEIYNQAYEASDYTSKKGKEDEERRAAKVQLEALEKIKDNIEGYIPKGKDYIDNFENLRKFADVITDGLDKMNSFKSTPQIFRPLRDWAIDKSSDTFGNLAYRSYKEFKDKAPIISIENPPVGMGLARAKDLKEVIEASRDKFVDQLMNKEGMSKSEAEKKAEKAIGATWDVGHINMLRKFGYGSDELKKETGIIAGDVNKIHLSDNFGMEHTELPMGMGNVPMQEHMKKLKEAHGEKLKEIKQIIEAGNWYEPFKSVPFVETLSAYGTAMSAGGSGWNQYASTQGGYFAGLGYNPEVHHSIYGSGFSGLPVELGGQMQGKSRFSGAPIE